MSDIEKLYALFKAPDTMSFPGAVTFFENKGLRYELEERAAIREYDGGMDRDEAERHAVNELLSMYRGNTNERTNSKKD